MAEFTARVGSDGRPAFAIPIAYSSHDPELLALDGIGFTAWLDQRGWTSPVLRSHLRYCMRDDYGCEPQHVSAWAGIHRSEEHTSELQSPMRISYAVICLKKKK